MRAYGSSVIGDINLTAANSDDMNQLATLCRCVNAVFLPHKR